MESGAFLTTRNRETPLSIGLKKNFGVIISTIFNVYDKTAQKNIYAFRSFEDSIVPLNEKGFKGLDKFYKIILRISDDTGLPKFCDEKVKLPIIIQSNFIIPKPKEFMDKDKYSSNGKAVMYLQTLIRLNLTLGSKDSLEFLDSLASCPETSIFKTRFIKTILREKWIRIGWILYIQTAIFVAYLISFSVYTTKYHGQGDYLIIPFNYNKVLFIYEIFQM